MRATIDKVCPECEGDNSQLSNCCGGTFGEPGWPDNDICGSCGEHSHIHICQTCKGKGVVRSEFEIPKIIQDQLIKEKNLPKQELEGAKEWAKKHLKNKKYAIITRRKKDIN